MMTMCTGTDATPDQPAQWTVGGLASGIVATDIAKRLIFGRALSSDRLGDTLLPKRIALPVFASDALSSVSYATQEILLVLSVGGLALITMTPWLAIAVAVVMVVVVLSYRQNVRAYPSGGGDYEVATVNIGPNAGVAVASALFVDYVMTVAVSVAAAVANLGSIWSGIGDNAVPISVAIIVLLTMMNLRGVRESGTLFAIPTYAFVAGIFLMVIWAGVRLSMGDTLLAQSAGYELRAEEQFTGAALVLLIARAFSSGCTALTGVEAISNGVPAFKYPKEKNAATTLALLGGIAITMFLSVTALALITKVKVAENTADLIGSPPGQPQSTVIAQVADAVFGNFGFLADFVTLSAALILMLAANTAFNGFPVLGSILSRDGFLPRQLHTRGDRLAFSNGIIVLSSLAIFLVVIFDADVTRLIQLYIVGVFVSFTVSQFGMIRHWTRLLRDPALPGAESRKMKRNRVVNTIGFTMTGIVLIIVLISKFLAGAWIVCVAMPLLFWLMKSIHRHYDRVAEELSPDDDSGTTLPARVWAIVLVSKVHRPTLRALAYARATRPDKLEALVVNVEPMETRTLMDEWDRRGIPVSLKVLDSPFREITRPVVDYVRSVRVSSPRDLVTVYVPEYVVGHWWEHLLHNQSAWRLKARLLFTPGVMVVSVPWQLRSSNRIADEPVGNAAGAVRRGEPPAFEAEFEVATEMGLERRD